MRATGNLELILSGATRLAVLGVGSELRSDDAAGMIVAGLLERRFPRRPDLLVAKGGAAPENLSGPILAFRPSHLVVVDCADLGLEPGGIGIASLDRVDGPSASSHILPLRLLVGYLLASRPCEVVAVGIQPERLDFGGRPSRPARRAARRVAAALARALRAMGRRAREGGR